MWGQLCRLVLTQKEETKSISNGSFRTLVIECALEAFAKTQSARDVGPTVLTFSTNFIFFFRHWWLNKNMCTVFSYFGGCLFMLPWYMYAVQPSMCACYNGNWASCSLSNSKDLHWTNVCPSFYSVYAWLRFHSTLFKITCWRINS